MFWQAIVCLLCFTSFNLPQAIPAEKPVSEKQRAEEAADRFIRRWHETFDLNVLFDEMFVAKPENRRVFTNLFSGLSVYIGKNLDGPGIAKDVDEKLMRSTIMAVFNLIYLQAEYALAFGALALEVNENNQEELESELEPGVEVLTRGQLTGFIASLEKSSAEFRKDLKAEVFKSALYQLNLKKDHAAAESSSKVFEVTRKDISECGGGRSVKIYRLKRGVFDFHFVEEEGKLKVLSLGFEPC